MTATVVPTPDDLPSAAVSGRTAVVFDVLRATTTMTAALAAGVDAIRIFSQIDAARSAAASFVTGKKLLCGEINCLPPPGFDLGNSPCDWSSADCAGYTLFMATTNGTRAITAAAAQGAGTLLIGALVNAKAVANAAAATKTDVILLCSGTAGRLSLEDLIGAGAVLQSLTNAGFAISGEPAHIAHYLFEQTAADLPAALRKGAGGRNLIAAGLDADIDYCARLDLLSAVGIVEQDAAGLACRPLRS